MIRPRVLLSRRAIVGGMVSSGGLLLAGCNEQPPTYGNILRMGDNLTYDAQRLLLSRGALAREYDLADITSMPAIGTVDPANAKGGAEYGRLQRANFADWRLEVTGSVYRPTAFGLSDLKRMRSRTQITKHMCEEGWSAIAEWTGVPLRAVLETVGLKPSARFVQFHSFDEWADSVDIIDAFSRFSNRRGTTERVYR